MPLDRALDFAGERSDLAFQLATPLRELLRKEELDPLYEDIELPLVPVLVDIERAGIRMDGAALASQSGNIDAELARLATKIYEYAGEEFNINSPKKLSEILFDKLGMRTETIRRTTKTKAQSTASEVLEELALGHELPRLILEWRALMKLKGTYVDALPQLVNPDTGRVHTCFNQAVAATGRLSSSDPNLQNIPIRTEVGREIRRAFIADRGNVLISADYSQIELRVLAHLSDEDTLIDAFSRNEDIHDRTAKKVFGETSGLSAHELRRRAKIINYALLYGKQAFTLSKDIGVSVEEARQVHQGLFRRLHIGPQVPRRPARRHPAHRRREDDVRPPPADARPEQPQLPDARAGRADDDELPDPGQRRRHSQEGDDRRPQSVASVAGGKARMILTVHDELLFEAPKEAAEETSALVTEVMEKAVPLKVPLTVDVGIGENWKEAKS